MLITCASPCSLKVEAIWPSKLGPRFDLTVVTQLSFDRMPALFNQCSTFTGPIAAAVYLPLIQQSTEEAQHSKRKPLQKSGFINGGDVDQGLSAANQERVRQEVKRLGDLHKEYVIFGVYYYNHDIFRYNIIRHVNAKMQDGFPRRCLSARLNACVGSV